MTYSRPAPTMDADSKILQEKAILLIARERELNTLRNKHMRLLSWLSLTQSLPEVVDRRFSLAEIGAEFLSRIVKLIKLQRVHLLEIGEDGLRPFGTDHTTLPPLSCEAMQCLTEKRSGLVNGPESDCERTMAEALKLHRFIWYRLEADAGKMVLMIGGFDQQRASSYMPFDQEDVEHFAHAGQHFESLLSNVFLLNELERDKLRLEGFNEELEQRVQARTKELALANQETNEAFAALREKDRRLSDDLLQARAFQQSILPALPRSPVIEFGVMYCALDMVGGDVYDVAEISSGHYRIFMADATGHGVQASLRTIVIKSEYDRLKQAHAAPDSLLVELNRRLVGTYSQTEMLCTACCFDIVLTSAGASLRYCNAAHPPLLRRSALGVTEVYHGGPFLGLSSEIALSLDETQLDPGDLIVAYTDGISDQPGPDGALYNLPRAIEQSLGTGAVLQQGLDAVYDAFNRFRDNVPIGDDITMVAVRIASSN